MSIERKLNQSQWGVMRTDISRYSFEFSPGRGVELYLDGTYYGIVGSAAGTSARFHLFGMQNKDGYIPTGLDGKSIFGIYREDRNTDRLIFTGWYVLEGTLNAGKAAFSGSTDLIKDQAEFKVNRTNQGCVFTYLSKDGNAQFKVTLNVSASGTATGVLNDIRKNTDASYKTWDDLLNDYTGGSYTAELVRPHESWNNAYHAQIGFNTSTVYVYGNNLPTGFTIIAYNWITNTITNVASSLETWWNSKLPSDLFDAGTFAEVQWLNHPNAGLLAIFEKERDSDATLRRYWADFAQGQLVDVSSNTTTNGFVLDRMAASIANVVCYYVHDNDKYDTSKGKLIYTYYKSAQEKASGFVLRLWNYDMGVNSKGIVAVPGGDSSVFFLGAENDPKKGPTGESLVWMRRDNNSFRLEREDWGQTIASDAIGNEIYYLTGVEAQAGTMFVGYERYGAAFGPVFPF